MTELQKIVDKKIGPDVIKQMSHYCRALGYSISDAELIAKEWFSQFNHVIETLKKRFREKENQK